MTYQIRISDQDISFACEPGETVLDAAERAGYAIPYSCRKGACNTCEAALIAGAAAVAGHGGVIRGPCDPVLLCRTRPQSNLEIRPQRIDRTEPPARKRLPASVYRMTRPTPDVAVIQLRYPAGNRMKFKAGQYLQVELADGSRRSFSMANPPQESDGVQLHIRHVPGGVFSEGVLAALQAGDKLTIELPFGDFFLRDASADTPVILLATGTGFAPIKSIVEDAIKRGLKRPMRLYWGARRTADLYMPELPQKWAARHAWFAFIPVLSEAEADWTGRRGLVHQAVLDDHGDLSTSTVYACGNPLMIAKARHAFTTQAGLPTAAFHCDAFVPSGPDEAMPAAPDGGH
ncbi:2Fe-2S iron-sulfur cluster-binding protein [Ferrovibrio xuzhouensis]|uniref:2Fe-2S iron-sulfur cluster-binding protein n=1 Tax=Ferrovibrio xuzhouensis TaxID=1576914 RepID=A0ABV7VLC0_9PROT